MQTLCFNRGAPHLVIGREVASCKWPEAMQGQGWTEFYKDLGERGAALLQRSPRFCGEMKHAWGQGESRACSGPDLGGYLQTGVRPEWAPLCQAGFLHHGAAHLPPTLLDLEEPSHGSFLLHRPSAAECSLRPGGCRGFA